MNDGRYPLTLRHISGDVEIVRVKAQNINPSFKLSKEEELSEAKRQAFVSYGAPIGEIQLYYWRGMLTFSGIASLHCSTT